MFAKTVEVALSSTSMYIMYAKQKKSADIIGQIPMRAAAETFS